MIKASGCGASAATARVMANRVAGRIPIESISEQQKMDLVELAEKAARSFSPYVKQVDITYYDQLKRRNPIFALDFSRVNW